VPLQGATHFALITIIGSDEIRTYEQQNYICCINVIVDGSRKLCSSRDPTIMPRRDEALPLETGEMLLELVSKVLVGVRV
jgi:hypothetical protein